MNKLKALIVLLVVSLVGLIGVNIYMEPEAQPVSQETAEPESLGTFPEAPRKLTLFPFGGLFSGLLGAKLSLLGGLFGGYAPAPQPTVVQQPVVIQQPAPQVVETKVVEQPRVVNNINIINTGSGSSNLRSTLNSLNGRYGLNFPSISFEINDSEFIFNGCNTHRVPYQFDNSRFFFGKVRSTRNDCGFDSASMFVKQLGRLRRLGRRDNDIFFVDNSDSPIFGARLRNNGGRNRFAFSEIQQGIYDAEFPTFNVEVRDDQFWVQGCENDPVQFFYNKQGTVSFRKGFSDEDCYVGRREIFNDFFTNSQKIRFNKDKSYEFIDDHGASIVTCSPLQW